MNKQEEITKVYTKYDTPAFTVHVPYITPFVAVKDDADISFEPIANFVSYNLIRIERGLEGVRYFHYGK